MSSFFDGHIASIKPEIVEDIERLIALAEDQERCLSAAKRVSAYLEAYKANEEKV